MANPQVERGFTRIANELFPALVARDFSGAELRAIIAVIRLTYGFHKLEVDLSSQKLAALMGVSDRYARGVLSGLVQKGVLQLVERARGPKAPTIRFVKNYDAWKQRSEADTTLWDMFEPEPREPDASVPGNAPELPGNPEPREPASRNPESRLAGCPSSGFPGRKNPSETPGCAIPEPVENSAKETLKERSKEIPLTPRKTRANPRALGTNPRANAGGGPPAPPEGKAKKDKVERSEFVALALREIYTFHGPVTPDTEENHARRLTEAVVREGEHAIAVAVREAIRAVTFKKHNESGVSSAPSMAVWLVCGKNEKQETGEVLDAAKAHQRSEVRRVKRSWENGLRKTFETYRWHPESSWSMPPRLAADPWLRATEIAAYCDQHKPAWDAELARQAGLPEGGAGPGPGLGLGAIGRDINEFE